MEGPDDGNTDPLQATASSVAKVSPSAKSLILTYYTAHRGGRYMTGISQLKFYNLETVLRICQSQGGEASKGVPSKVYIQSSLSTTNKRSRVKNEIIA